MRESPDALESLRAQGARLYVATSKPHVFAEQILEHFELTRDLQAIFGSEFERDPRGQRSAHQPRSGQRPVASRGYDHGR